MQAQREKTQSSLTEPVVVAVLGEICTRRNGTLQPLPGTRARSLLVALATHPGRSRSMAALIDDVWGDEPPRSPQNALHTQVSRLRAALPEAALELGPAGYRLVLDDDAVDLTRAGALERAARRLLDDGDHRAALDAVTVARALWRGDPGADLPDGDLARDLRATALVRRIALDDLEIAARTALGDLAGALPLVKARAQRNPFDEPAHLALMNTLADLGHAADALDVFAALRARLADQLGTDPGPALVEANTAILRGQAEPAASPTRAPTAIGLRAAPNALLGRDDDLAAIEALLRRSRVTTVLGPGGTGKTRVAHEIGMRVAHTEPVVLVELASLRSGGDVVGAICATLGLSEADVAPGTLVRAQLHSARERLRIALSVRPMLLILDNCEHLVADVAEAVADLVAASDQLTVLTTSRAPLMIAAETVYPLPPLAVDEAGSPATELFRIRARAVRPSARLDPVEVARLCRTIDGLPLAIELAAARVRTLSVAEINDRLGDRFTLLRSTDRTSPERHRTLRAVIDWSWNLLTPPEQAALRRLCRFPAGFTLDAAVAVAEWGAVDDAASALDGLVNQSLLDVLETDGGLRYHMLETVREFGEEETGDDEAVEVTRRMAAWARRLARDLSEGIYGERQIAAVHRVEAEHDNLVAILRAALERADAVTAYHVFPVLATLWAIRGAHTEVHKWSGPVLQIDARAHADEIPGDFAVLTYLLAGLHLMIAGDLRAIALIRTRIRALLRDRTDISGAVRINAALVCLPFSGKGLARSLATAVRSPDPLVRAAALMARANFSENFGDVAFSERDGLAALALSEELGDVWSLAMTCQHLGSLCGQGARFDEAERYYARAEQELSRLHAYEEGVAIRGYRAAALVGAGRVAEARCELEQILGDTGGFVRSPIPVNRAEGSQRLAVVHSALAEATLAEGEIERGLAEYRNALTVLGWPDADGLNPGPGESMLVSACVDAHVLHGRATDMDDTVRRLVVLALGFLGRYRDLPQIGAIGTAVGSHLIAGGTDPDRGLRMLALARNARGRQDLPSMALDRHVAHARTVLGADRVDAAIAAANGTPRGRAALELLEHLRYV